MDDQKRCAHKACTCSATRSSSYCSSYCEGAKSEHQAGDGCGCGHDACTQKTDELPASLSSIFNDGLSRDFVQATHV